MSKKHQSTVKYIEAHPYLICPRPIISASNVLFYKRSGGVDGEIDNVVFNGELYLVEYKTNISEEGKALRQLLRQERFVKALGYKGIVHRVFLHGDIK